MSPAGYTILVGRNRKENEQLTLQVARERDVWMHVRGSPGAHVVLQMSQAPPDAEPTEECLALAANLASFYSDLRSERKVLVMMADPKVGAQDGYSGTSHTSHTPLTFLSHSSHTPPTHLQHIPKHIKKPKGSPLGAVSVTKEVRARGTWVL